MAAPGDQRPAGSRLDPPLAVARVFRALCAPEKETDGMDTEQSRAGSLFLIQDEQISQKHPPYFRELLIHSPVHQF